MNAMIHVVIKLVASLLNWLIMLRDSIEIILFDNVVLK